MFEKRTNQNQSLPTFAPIASPRRSAPAPMPAPKRQCVPAKGFPPSSNPSGSHKGHRGGSFKGHTKIRRSIVGKLKRVYEYESLPLRNRTGAAAAFLRRHRISKASMKPWRSKKTKWLMMTKQNRLRTYHRRSVKNKGLFHEQEKKTL